MDNHHDLHRQRVFPAELSPVTPPSAYSRSRQQYSGNAEPPPLRPTNSYPVGGAYGNQHIRYPFELNRSSYRRMSEPEAPITVHENDVLMGRGGKNNQHSGNEKLRQLARGQAANYRASTKKGKSAISRDLVEQMCNLNPPARFLKRTNEGEWEDVGTDVAREKASQVLRDAVALLPEETESNHAEEDDDEPIAMNSAAPAAVTQDEMDRRPVAGMGPPQQPHVTPGLSIASSFPPASPMEQSRKRHRDYYHQDYAPHSYHNQYHASRYDYPHQHGYHHESPTQRPRYGMGGGGQPYYPDYPGHDPYSPTRSRMPPSQYYSQQGQYHHQRGSSAASLSPPRRHQPYHPSMPHSHPGYARSHAAVGDFFPPPSSMPSPHHRRRTSAPEPSQPPQRSQYPAQQPQGSSPPDAQQQQPIPYHSGAPSSHAHYSGSPTRYPPPPPPHSHGYPPHQHSSPVTMLRRPQAVGEGFRQHSAASAHSLLGDVGGVDPNNGVNEFDLFNGELLASDTENSPRQRYHPYAYPGQHYRPPPPPPPPPGEGTGSPQRYPPPLPPGEGGGTGSPPHRYPPPPPPGYPAQQQHPTEHVPQPPPQEEEEEKKPAAREPASLEQPSAPPSLGASPSVDEGETLRRRDSD